MIHFDSFFQRGQTLLEAVVAVAVISIMLVLSLSSLVDIMRGQVKSNYQLAATRYALEGMEVVYHLYANVGFAGMVGAVNKPVLYPDVQAAAHGGSRLSEAAALASVDGVYSREIHLSYARRDPGTGNLVEAGGAEDPRTIKAVSKVNWPKGEGIEFVTYLTKMEIGEE